MIAAQAAIGGIYLHIPYCRQACTYCDFFFRTNQDSMPGFLAALHAEIELRADFFAPGTGIQTIYVGGGTPSLLPPAALQDILSRLRDVFPVAANAEITLEANPDDLRSDVLEAWLDAGINRLSIGLQSLDEAQLRFMNRAHDAKQARAAVPMAHAAGFHNLSIDLIYHLPDLSLAAWADTLAEVLAWQVPHLSCYGLTVEPRTALARQVAQGQVAIPPDEAFAEQFALLRAKAGQAGYQHYETSNFALPGMQSRHNSSYWHGLPYLGLGPSAHGFDGKLTRYANASSIHTYVDALAQRQLPPGTIEVLTPENRFNEALLTALRLVEGCPLQQLEALAPAGSWRTVFAEIEALQHAGWLLPIVDRVQLAPTALHLADAAAARLFLV